MSDYQFDFLLPLDISRHDSDAISGLSPEGSLEDAIKICKDYEIDIKLIAAPGFAVGRVHADGSYTLG